MKSKTLALNLASKYSYLFLLIPVFFVAYPLLSVKGIPIGNGDLPYIEISLFPDKKLWTWNEYGSFHGMEALPRYPIIALFGSMNLPPDITSKFLIISLFAVASFSFYFSVSRLFKTKIDTDSLKFRMMALAGSLFYAYNVWSFHRIGHWYFWLGYALLPLFFISVIYAFRYPRKIKYVVASAFLWSVASSTPHMAIFFGIVFAGLSAKLIVDSIRKKNRKLSLLHAARPITLVVLVYVSVNLYWIYPYVLSSQSENFQWSAAVTEETTRELSRESDLLNVIRLLEGTFNMGKINVIPNQSSEFYSIWIVASFVVPVVAFSALAWWKTILFRYAVLFSIISVIGILLTMGTNAPFDSYLVMLFHIPMVSILQILLREPDKWGFLVAFGFSFLLVISGFNLLNKFERLAYRKIISTSFVALLLISIAVYFYPAYMDSIENLYRPVVLPVDFNDLNKGWNTVGGDKTFVMPYAPYNTTWGKDKGVLDLYSIAAPVPNIAPSDYNSVEKYHKYLVNSLVRNKTNNLQDIIYPLGTSNLIYHNDSLFPQNVELLAKLKDSVAGLNSIKDVGLFKIFNVGGNEKFIQQTEVPRDNTLVVGGLDRFASLSAIPNFNTINSSLVFLDQQIKDEVKESSIEGADSLLLLPNRDSFILSLLEDKYILAPYEKTNRHEPTRVWSKAGSNDPGNAWFTPYLEDLGMQNWDFDYGKGLVITQAMGAKLSMPFNIAEAGEYDIFARFLKNQKGGILNVYLDNKLVDRINTIDESTNTFEWQNILEKTGSLPLKEGKHTLTLENAAGFNAVNLFGIIPSGVTAKLEDYANSLANRMKNILLLEAETSFLVDNNESGPLSTSDYYYLLRHKGNNSNASSQFFEQTSAGQFMVPNDKDLLDMKLIAKQDGNSSVARDNNNSKNSFQPYYLVNNFKIFPANRSSLIYLSDFENKQENLPLAIKARISLGPYDALPFLLSENGARFDGKQNLRVNIGQGNTSNWNIVSTDFIPVNDFLKSIQYNLSVSAKDVRQLHSKVVYYDSNKNETGWDFIFGGRDGTYNHTIANTLQVPEDTKFMKVQMFAANNPIKGSSYTIDKLDIIPFMVKAWNNNNDLSSVSLEQNLPVSGKASLKVDIGENGINATDWSIVSSDFIPVDDKAYYNVSMDVSAKDVWQLHPKIVYYDSKREHILNMNDQEEVNEIFFSKDGTFTRRYVYSPTIPLGAKYMQLQMWASLSGSSSRYLLDNVKVEEIIPDMSLFDNNFASFEGVRNSTSLLRGQAIAENNNHYSGDEYNGVQLANRGYEGDSNLNNDSLKVTLENNNRMGKLINDSMGITNNFTDMSNIYNNSSLVNVANYTVIHTKPIPVRPGSLFDYDISVEGRNIAELSAIADFKNSSNVVEDSRKYGPNASAGGVLTLSPGSQIYSYVDILKPANYSVALRAGVCENCSSIRLAIIDKDKDKAVKSESISLKQGTQINDEYGKYNRDSNKKENGSNELQWVSLNKSISLDPGRYEIKIASDSKADLDSMIIYSTVAEYDANNKTIKNSPSSVKLNRITESHEGSAIEDLFYDEDQYLSVSSQNISSSKENTSRAAIISEYKKINPTKHEIKIQNATRPFMISFAESYDPLWIAQADEITQNTEVGISNANDDNKKEIFKTRSIPLYSIINGFYVNKTGDFTLTIEYEPQKWFEESSIVSLVAIIITLGFLIVEKKRRKL